MIISKKYDISIINLYLEGCSDKQNFHYGEDAYKFLSVNNVIPNQITFGIMIKIFGFARKLNNAFDLIDLMSVYGIKKSIIIYTNLIHICFYCRKPKKAEYAF